MTDLVAAGGGPRRLPALRIGRKPTARKWGSCTTPHTLYAAPLPFKTGLPFPILIKDICPREAKDIEKDLMHFSGGATAAEGYTMDGSVAPPLRNTLIFLAR